MRSVFHFRNISEIETFENAKNAIPKNRNLETRWISPFSFGKHDIIFFFENLITNLESCVIYMVINFFKKA